MPNEWIKEFSGAITVTDVAGKIIEMNDKALLNFKKYAGFVELSIEIPFDMAHFVRKS